MQFTQAQVETAASMLQQGDRQVKIARALGISLRQSRKLMHFLEHGDTKLQQLMQQASCVYEVALETGTGMTSARTKVQKANGTYNPVEEELRATCYSGASWRELKYRFDFETIEYAKDAIQMAFPGAVLTVLEEHGDTWLYPVTVLPAFREACKPGVTAKWSENYLWLKLPDLAGPELRLYNFTDVHFGSRAHRNDIFDRCFQHFLEDQASFFFDGGDTTESNNRQSAGDPMEQYLTNNEQIEEAVRKYKPGRDRMLFKVWGNHCGGRSEKACQLDTSRIIAQFLETPYFHNRVIIDLEWRGMVRTIFATHRWGKAIDQAAVVKACRQVQGEYPGILFHWFTSGHTHQAWVQRMNFRQRIVGEGLTSASQYTVNGGSFVRQSETYADDFTPMPQDLTFLRLREDGKALCGAIPIDHL